MAATEANRRNRSTSNRNRLPLTPNAPSRRGGSHGAARVGERGEAPAVAIKTTAMHLTPNVVIAARGDVGATRRARPALHITPNVVIAARGNVSPRPAARWRSLLKVDASDLRRFRA